jgi:hypothetical protein
MVMRGLCVVLVATGALVVHARTAVADCAVELDGDPAVTAPIRIELGGYGSASGSCIAVHAACRGDGGEVQIELRDELGRTSQRWFASAGGAAAFIVSWSRRPLAGAAPGMDIGAGPGATAPSAAPMTPTPTRDKPWHPEVDLGYVNSSNMISGWAFAGAAVMRQSGIWRYGVTLRGITEVSDLSYLAIEGLAVIGVTSPIMPRWSLGLDVAAGGTLARAGEQAQGDYGAKGPRVAVRASLGWQLIPPIELQLALGFDVMHRSQAVPIGPTDQLMHYEDTMGFAHLDVAMRWLP